MKFKVFCYAGILMFAAWGRYGETAPSAVNKDDAATLVHENELQKQIIATLRQKGYCNVNLSTENSRMQLVSIHAYNLNPEAYRLLATLASFRWMRLGLFLPEPDPSDSRQIDFSALGKLDGLYSLSICRYQLTVKDCKCLSQLTSLRELAFYSCYNVSDKHIRCFSRLQWLSSLTIDSGRVAGPGLKALSRLKHLREFDLRNNRLTNQAAGLLKDYLSLESLDLRGNDFTDDCLDDLKAIPKLRELILPVWRFTDDALKKFRESMPGVKVSGPPIGAPG